MPGGRLVGDLAHRVLEELLTDRRCQAAERTAVRDAAADLLATQLPRANLDAVWQGPLAECLADCLTWPLAAIHGSPVDLPVVRGVALLGTPSSDESGHCAATLLGVPSSATPSSGAAGGRPGAAAELAPGQLPEVPGDDSAQCQVPLGKRDLPGELPDVPGDDSAQCQVPLGKRDLPGELPDVPGDDSAQCQVPLGKRDLPGELPDVPGDDSAQCQVPLGKRDLPGELPDVPGDDSAQCQVPLGKRDLPGRLVDIPLSDFACELPFLLRVAGRDDDVNLARLGDALRQSESPLVRSYGPRVQRIRRPRLRGFLAGFIDLVYRWQGRWYVLDYKTNQLGPRADYDTERLGRAMAEHDYLLQAHLYAVAVNRLLRQRVPDYQYERDFGGFVYLFLRGLDATGRTGAGVYFHRPSERVVAAMSDTLAGRQAEEPR